MDPARSVNIDRLRREIDATRASISRTAGELRWKAGETMRWETYVERYPASILAAVTVLGIAVGRRMARGSNTNGRHDQNGGWTPPAISIASLPRPSAQLDHGADRFGRVTASWQRLGTRVEGLVNRVIDEAADAAERALVPALVSGIQALFEGAAPRPVGRPGHRSAPPDGPPAPPGEGRLA